VTSQPDPQLVADVDAIYHGPTSYRDHRQPPAYGTAPPVPQPGIPPQSKAAVDYAVRVLSTGVATAMASGGLAGVLLASQVADPVVCGIVFGAPIGLTIPIAALSVALKRWKTAAPRPTINQYNGPVYQQTTHTENRGVWAKNINRQ
jgi:hypothetical protein